MSRLKHLEARRRVLIERCAAQRVELAGRLAELDPLTMLRGAGAAYAGPALRHPLAWAAALAGLLFLGRTRELLTFVLWARSAVSLVARVMQVVRLAGELRGPRAAKEATGKDTAPATATPPPRGV